MHRNFNNRVNAMRVGGLSSPLSSACRRIVAIGVSACPKLSIAMKWVKPSFYRRSRCSERHRLYKASADTSEGLAYRYALAELNPFALTSDVSIYIGHNAAGKLNLYNPDTGAGGNDTIEGEEARQSLWKEAV